MQKLKVAVFDKLKWNDGTIWMSAFKFKVCTKKCPWSTFAEVMHKSILVYTYLFKTVAKGYEYPTRQRSSTQVTWHDRISAAWDPRDFTGLNSGLQTRQTSTRSTIGSGFDAETRLPATHTIRRRSEAAVNFCLGWVQAERHWQGHWIDQWRPRLRACVRASGQHFEQLINWDNCLSVEWFCFYKDTFLCDLRI